MPVAALTKLPTSVERHTVGAAASAFLRLCRLPPPDVTLARFIPYRKTCPLTELAGKPRAVAVAVV
jgi:hypothetical protein